MTGGYSRAIGLPIQPAMGPGGDTPRPSAGWFATPAAPPVQSSPSEPAGFGDPSGLPPAPEARNFAVHPAPRWSGLQLLGAVAVLAGVIAAVVVLTGGSGAGSGSYASQYPPALAAGFTSGCERQAPASWGQVTAITYCDAALTCVEQRMSPQTLERTAENMFAGRSNPTMLAVDACAASALKSTPGLASAAAGVSGRQSADASAEETARTAEVTIETIATDNGGSYSSVNDNPSALSAFESSLQTSPGHGAYVSSVSSGASTYAITVTSTTGDKFTIEYNDGIITRTCAPAGHANCASGTW